MLTKNLFKLFWSQSINWLILIMLLTTSSACAIQGLGLGTPEPVVQSTGPTVTIASPTAGQKVELGRQVRVASISTDVGGVARIELLVNNTIIRTDANPSPEASVAFQAIQPWVPTMPGPAVIQIRAYNLANVVGQSELIMVEVITPSAAVPAATLPLPTAGFVIDNPSPTLPPLAVCTPPICGEGEVIYCPGDCPNGCGVQCATPTPMPATEPTVIGATSPPAPAAPGPPPTVVPSLPAIPAGTELILDNKSPEFQTSGAWYIGDGGQSYAGDCAWAPRGVNNNAIWRSRLPAAGMYEVFAWWCGDPNHDQSGRANYFIETANGRQPVQVNLQEQAGQWHSLGQYFFQAGEGSLVQVNGGYDGNVIADAIRFVYLSPEPLPAVIPTPLPTPQPVIAALPSQLEQATSADLAVRLNLTGVTPYRYTPIINQEEMTFDDCLTFPGDGCSGSRPGWRVQVEYVDQSGQMVITYHVSHDYQLVTLEPSAALAGRQRVFLTGHDGRNLSFEVDRAPRDRAWRLFIHSGQNSFNPDLPPATFALLEELSQRYSSVQVSLPGGGVLQLYGLGQQARLSAEDWQKLEGFSRQLLQQIP